MRSGSEIHHPAFPSIHTLHHSLLKYVQSFFAPLPLNKLETEVHWASTPPLAEVFLRVVFIALKCGAPRFTLERNMPHYRDSTAASRHPFETLRPQRVLSKFRGVEEAAKVRNTFGDMQPHLGRDKARKLLLRREWLISPFAE